MREKRGNWYASVAPAPGQKRRENPFGKDEAAARAWLFAATAADDAGRPLPSPDHLRTVSSAHRLP